MFITTSVKDGVDWTEVSGIPDGFADGVDDIGGDGHSLDAADGSPNDAVYVDDAGNVGIGTTNPNEKLHIEDASMKITGFNGTQERIFLSGDSSSPYIELFGTGATKIKILSSGDSYFNGGNVGIGTTSPTEALDVNGNVKATNFIGNGSGLTGVVNTESDPIFSGWDKSTGILISESQISDLNHFTNTDETDPTVAASVKDGVDWSELSGIPAGFADGTDNDEDSDWTISGNDMYSSVSGNVGIGTTNPGMLLSLATGTSPDGLHLYRADGTSVVGYLRHVDYGGGDWRGQISLKGNLDSSEMLLDGATSGTSWLPGNVGIGIGVAALAARLQVRGDGTNLTAKFVDSSETEGKEVVIDKDGKVGIGTTSPGSELEVDGTVTASAFVGDGSGLTNLGEAQIGWEVDGDTVYHSTGNVGIGSTEPGTDLHIYGGASGGIARGGTALVTIENNDNAFLELLTTDTKTGGVLFSSSEGSERGGMQYTHTGAISDYMRFFVGAEEKVRIQQNGNVGIGTTSPTEALDVNGNVKATNFIGNGSGLTGVVNTESDPIFTDWDKSTGILISESQISDLNHFTNTDETDPTVAASVKDGVDWSELSGIPAGFADGTDNDEDSDWTISGNDMYSSVSGNVGIGNTEPGVKLEVHDSLDDSVGKLKTTRDYPASNTLILAHSRGIDNVENEDYMGILFKADSDSADEGLTAKVVMVSEDVSAQKTALAFHTKDGEKVRITNNGNMGIGITNPSKKLEVAGIIKSTLGGIEFPDGTVQASAAIDLIEADGIIGNEVVDAADTTLSKSGAGTDADPYKLALNLANDNSWTGEQTFNDYTYFPGSGIWDNAGNVGIGTTSPSDRFSIQIGEEELTGISISDPDSSIAYLGDGAGAAEAGLLKLWDHNGIQSVQIYAGAAYSWLGMNENVGIGTTNPSEKLEVAGTVKATEFNLNGDAITSWPSGGSDSDWTISGNDMYSSVSGNVGIGTTSPGQKLEVEAGHTYLNSTAVNGTGNANLYLEQGGREYRFYQYSRDNNATVDLRLNTPGQSNAVTFQDDGYVGIGTTNPAQKLHVAGGAAISGNVGIGTTSPGSKLEVYGMVHSTSGGFRLPDGTVLDDASDLSGGGGIGGSGADNYIPRWNGTDALENAAIYQSDTGNVGIGTTSPGTELEVKGALTINRLDSHLYLTGASSNGMVSVVNDRMMLGNWDNTVNSINVDLPTGNVGIGTTAPNAKIDIRQAMDSQGIKIYGYDDKSTNNGHLYIDGAGNFVIDSPLDTMLFKVLGSNIGIITDTKFLLYDNKISTYGTGQDYSIGYHSSSDSLRVVTGTTLDANVRMAFDPSGNLGIGTTSPSERLEVAGTVKATAFVGDGSALTGINEGDASYGSSASSPDDAVYVDDAGKVGIGTMSPGSTLHVGSAGSPNTVDGIDDAYIYGDLEVNGVIYGNGSGITGVTGSPSGSNGYIQYNNGGVMNGDSGLYYDDINSRVGIGGISSPEFTLDVNGDVRLGNVILFGGTNSYPRIRQQADGLEIRTHSTDDAFFITDTGNVGIGTTSPDRLLHISGIGSANRTGVRIENSNSQVGGSWDIVMGDNSTSIGDGSFAIERIGGSGGNLVIKDDGNVGIGTTDPGGTLEVANTTGVSIALTRELGLQSETRAMIAYEDSTEGLEFRVNNTGGGWAGTTKMVIRDTGNVGIGTTNPNPGSTLHIVGGHGALRVETAPSAS